MIAIFVVIFHLQIYLPTLHSKVSATLRPQRCFESGDLFMALSNCINPAAAILRHQSRDSRDKLFWTPLQHWIAREAAWSNIQFFAPFLLESYIQLPRSQDCAKQANGKQPKYILSGKAFRGGKGESCRGSDRKEGNARDKYLRLEGQYSIPLLAIYCGTCLLWNILYQAQ